MVEARKPYTITKQREKWTQEEHKKFLEALKLYGRAWRQIEEHVGNKTAVQLRSHAQKFFSKVVRESSSGDGTEVEPIEIPPPRPKRKPTHPYPRKVSVPIKKEARLVTSTSPESSGLSHEKGSPKSIQSLKLFGKTFFVMDSARPSSPESLPTLPWNSIATQEPESPSAMPSLSVFGDLGYHLSQSSDRIEPTTQCSSQDGKKDELGSKGDKGFVPYKNCLADKSVHSFMSTDEERKDIRDHRYLKASKGEGGGRQTSSASSNRHGNADSFDRWRKRQRISAWVKASSSNRHRKLPPYQIGIACKLAWRQPPPPD